MLGRPEFRPGRKIDCDHPANVSYRKVWSADILIVGQARKKCRSRRHPRSASAGICSRDTGPGKALLFNPGVAFRKASRAA
jgi:hypothetical protein